MTLNLILMREGRQDFHGLTAEGSAEVAGVFGKLASAGVVSPVVFVSPRPAPLEMARLFAEQATGPDLVEIWRDQSLEQGEPQQVLTVLDRASVSGRQPPTSALLVAGSAGLQALSKVFGAGTQDFGSPASCCVLRFPVGSWGEVAAGLARKTQPATLYPEVIRIHPSA